MDTSWTLPLLGLALLSGGLAACGDKDADGGEVVAGLVLEDVNPTSATFGQQVELGPVGDAATAWYFTHST